MVARRSAQRRTDSLVDVGCIGYLGFGIPCVSVGARVGGVEVVERDEEILMERESLVVRKVAGLGNGRSAGELSLVVSSGGPQRVNLSCPRQHSTELTRGLMDVNKKKRRTCVSLSDLNPTINLEPNREDPEGCNRQARREYH